MLNPQNNVCLSSSCLASYLIQKSNTHYQTTLQDASPNLTIYLLLAKTASTPKQYGQYKVLIFFQDTSIHNIFLSSVPWCKLVILIYQTSIVFCLEEGPGILYKALGASWKREISLTKVLLGILTSFE